jgi:hypothetical protein
MKKVFHTEVVEKNQNKHFTLNNLFRTSRNLWYNVEKYGRARQATDGNTAGACISQIGKKQVTSISDLANLQPQQINMMFYEKLEAVFLSLCSSKFLCYYNNACHES